MKKTRRSTERQASPSQRSRRRSSSSTSTSSSSSTSAAHSPAPRESQIGRSDLESLLEDFVGRGRRAQNAADELVESFGRRASRVLDEPDDE